MSELDRIVCLLGERTGLTFPEHRLAALEATVRSRMEKAGCTTLAELALRLAADRASMDELIEQVTIGETYFFREAWAFRRLRQSITRADDGSSPPLRLWSAGCSSGEEAYSLTMTALDAGRGDGLHLIATDISSASLARARAARYGEWSLRGEGRAAALPYLERSGDAWVVAESIRRRVRFEPLNLALDPYPSFARGLYAFDVIFCRNVLVYFDAETVARVARKLSDCLAEGGLLFLAATDPPIDPTPALERMVTDEGIHYRKAKPLEARPPTLEVRRAPPPIERTESRPAPPPSPAAVLERARAALARGDHVRAEILTESLLDDADAAAVHLRAVAAGAPRRALPLSETLTSRHSLAVEIHYLRALLLLEAGQLDDAAATARRVLYLDRTLEAAHFALASILERSGDAEGARRSYRNARDLCRARAAEEGIRLSNGEPAWRLAEVADAQLANLETS